MPQKMTTVGLAEIPSGLAGLPSAHTTSDDLEVPHSMARSLPANANVMQQRRVSWKVLAHLHAHLLLRCNIVHARLPCKSAAGELIDRHHQDDQARAVHTLCRPPVSPVLRPSPARCNAEEPASQ